MTVHREGSGDESSTPPTAASGAGDANDPSGRSSRPRPRLLLMAIVLVAIAVLVPVRIVFEQVHEPESTPGSVTIANYDFGPSPLKVESGAKVRFTNGDDASHTVTADDKSFESDVLRNGQSFEVTVSKTVTYHCDIHPTMQGTIEVGG